MASAGRILIMPKGDWKEETEYEMLDLVYHNGTSWLAKRSVFNAPIDVPEMPFISLTSLFSFKALYTPTW